MKVRIFVSAVILGMTPLLGETIWLEGESAGKREIQRNGWYSSVKKGELSEGGALMHWGNREGRAVFSVRVPEEGKYAMWLRANPVQSKLKVRVGEGSWIVPSLSKESVEQVNIASDNKPDLRFVGWARAGILDLPEGETTVEIRFASTNNHHGILDCLCLTTDLEWKPRGVLKPGEETPFWPVPEVSDANLDQWLDFIRPSSEELGWRAVRWHRSLSEAAGEAGNLGRPVLLWAMNGHPCGET